MYRIRYCHASTDKQVVVHVNMMRHHDQFSMVSNDFAIRIYQIRDGIHSVPKHVFITQYDDSNCVVTRITRTKPDAEGVVWISSSLIQYMKRCGYVGVNVEKAQQLHSEVGYTCSVKNTSPLMVVS